MNPGLTIDDEGKPNGGFSNDEIVPLPAPGGIQALREKLHVRMAALRRGGSGNRQHLRNEHNVRGEATDKDELLEERRRQRAALREKRRKATKEKISREEEMKGKKSKGKDHDNARSQKEKGSQTKVCRFMPFSLPDIHILPMIIYLRRSYSCQTNRIQ